MVIVLESLSRCSIELPSFWWLFFLLIYGAPMYSFYCRKKTLQLSKDLFSVQERKEIIKKPTQHCVNVLIIYLFFTFWPMFSWIEFFLNECASHWAQMLSAFHSKISVSTLWKNSRPKDLTFSFKNFSVEKRNPWKIEDCFIFLYACQSYLNDKKIHNAKETYTIHKVKKKFIALLDFLKITFGMKKRIKFCCFF